MRVWRPWRATLAPVARRLSNSATETPGLGVGGLAFFSAITATTGGLGAWQCQRYFEKVAQVEERARALAEPPSHVYHAEDMKEAPVYQKVALTGKYLHDKEMRLINRGPPESRQRLQGGLASGPIGEYVVTPLQLADHSTIFVNRGWVPRKADGWARPAEEVRVVGVVTALEQENTFSPPNSPKKDGGRLFWTEEQQMKGYAGLDATALPGRLVQAIDEEGEGAGTSEAGLMRKVSSDFMAFPVSPETHMGYAATWFGLCFFGVVLTALRARRGGGSAGLGHMKATPEALRPDLRKGKKGV